MGRAYLGGWASKGNRVSRDEDVVNGVTESGLGKAKDRKGLSMLRKWPVVSSGWSAGIG